MDQTSIGFWTILAIVLGPILAVQAQKWLERHRDERYRKLAIFKTLMSYRATPISAPFVQSLNLIYVEFSSKRKKEREVLDAWKVLFSHLGDTPQGDRIQWEQRRQDKTGKLLKAMSECLGYSFDEVVLTKGGYYPEWFASVEQEQHALRRSLLDLFEGKRRLPVAVLEEKFPALRPIDKPTKPS